jgi:hypothetical protein
MRNNERYLAFSPRLQPFLKRFSRYPIYVPDLEQYTFSIEINWPAYHRLARIGIGRY